MVQQKITGISFGIALTILGLMWLVFAADYLFELNWYKFGLRPRTWEGLLGIFTSPFLHSTRDTAHILNNSVPTFVLSWMLFYHYRTIATQVFLVIFLLTGIGVWIMARDSYHIGMSGVIYGLTSFLIFSGFFRKNLRVAAISLVVIFLYGSMIWGVFPIEERVSWEAHAMGFFSGAIATVLYSRKGPQPQKFTYEIEEELGIEPDYPYWEQTPQETPQQNQGPIVINYTIVPKTPQVIHQKKDEEE